MGFTLLEIMVAMVILATILSTIYASFSDTFKNINYAESQADIYQMAQITLERIQEDLECSLVFEEEDTPDNSNGSESEGFFAEDEQLDDNDADSLTFLSTRHLSLDEDDEYSGLTRIAFYVEENDEEEGLVLYRSDTPEFKEAPEPKTDGLILCDSLLSVNFTYYDADEEEHDSWNSSEGEFKGRLPAMVSIQLEFLNKSNPEETLKFEAGVALPMARDKYGQEEP